MNFSLFEGLDQVVGAGYARFSDEDLQDDTSIEDQVRLLRRETTPYCPIPDNRIFTDHGISGTISQRPGYQAMLKAARNHEFNVLFIESQSRLGRDQAEIHSAIKRFRHWGIKIISVATGTDLTDEETGPIITTITALQDAMFITNLRKQTRRGIEGALNRGLSVGGRTFGYNSVPVPDPNGRTKRGKLIIRAKRVINPEEAEVVRYIHRLYALEGLTPRAIARRLNNEGVPAPRTARGQRRGSWSPSTIAGSSPRAIGILNNWTYIGKIPWNRSRKVKDPDTGRRIMRSNPESEWRWFDAPELRIIPADLWGRTQARRAQRRFTISGQTGGARSENLLTGKLTCGECDGHYNIQRHRKGGQALRLRGPLRSGAERMQERDSGEARRDRAESA